MSGTFYNVPRALNFLFRSRPGHIYWFLHRSLSYQRFYKSSLVRQLYYFYWRCQFFIPVFLWFLRTTFLKLYLIKKLNSFTNKLTYTYIKLWFVKLIFENFLHFTIDHYYTITLNKCTQNSLFFCKLKKSMNLLDSLFNSTKPVKYQPVTETWIVGMTAVLTIG